MNNARRKEIANITNTLYSLVYPNGIEDLESIQSEIEMVLMDEEFAFESMPENLQYSMRGEASQEAQDNLQNAIDVIEDYVNDVEEDDATEEDREDRFNDMINDVISYLEDAAI